MKRTICLSRAICHIGVLAAVLAAATTLAPLRSSASAGHLSPPVPGVSVESGDIGRLLERAELQGYVRVIVGLAIPGSFQPEGVLDPQTAAGQRSAIAASRTALLDHLAAYQARPYATYHTIPYVALMADAPALQAVLASPLVTSVVEDVPVPLALASSTAWLGLPEVWASGIEGEGQSVVLLDTGIDTDHPFLSSRLVDGACFSNAGGIGDMVSLCADGSPFQTGIVAAESDTTNPACWLDNASLCGHGTHVAGIAAGGDDHTFDGVAPAASIIAIQVFTRFENYNSCGGMGTCAMSYTSDQLSALEYVYTELSSQYSIAAVNMSLGSGHYVSDCDTNPRKAAIDNLRAAGIATVVAAGNDNWTDAVTSPACISTAVTVSGVSDTDTPPPDTVAYNMSSLVDVLAPARHVTSSSVGGGYGVASGTSMAAPHVTGAFALCKSVNPALSVDQIEAILEQTGVSVTDTRPEGDQTKPRIQLDAAVAACQGANRWTGAAGADWQDPNNWSLGVVPDDTTFAGIPALPDGQSPPHIDADTAVRSLVVEPSGSLDISGGVLTVTGSVQVVDGGQLNATGGTTVFLGEYPHRISLPAGSQVFNLQLGAGTPLPAVSVASDLAIAGDLVLNPGSTLDLGTHSASVEGAVDNHGTLVQTGDVSAGLTQFLHLSNVAGDADKYRGIDLTTTGEMGSTTVAVQGNAACSASAERVQRCFQITPATPLAADVKFYFQDTEAGGTDDPVAHHWNGAGWDPLPTGGQGGSGNTMFVVAPAVGSYSSFELGDVNPLAVTLAGFSALSQPDHILVSWDTVSEVGNAGFALWRGPSPQARPQQLAFIPSQDPGSGQGFSYSYRDRDLVPGRTYWYWLDAVDLNGRAARYGPVSATYASPFNED